MVEEVSKKKRVAIYKKGALTIRFDYGFMSDEELENSLKDWAEKTNSDYDGIITYTLGDQDAEEEGVLYFCPKCGSYNEDGYDPDTRMYYRKNETTGKHEEAGYHKSNSIDCSNCNEVFEVHTEKYLEESRALTKLFIGGKENEGITN